MRADQSANQTTGRELPLSERERPARADASSLSNAIAWHALQLERTTANCNVYSARHVKTDSAGELVVVSTREVAWIKAVHAELRRSQLLGNDHFRKVLDHQLHHAAPYVVLEPQADQTLTSFLAKASEPTQWHTILRVLERFAAAQQLGFQLNHCHPSSLRVHSNGSLQLDLFTCSVFANASTDPSELHGWKSFSQIIQQLIAHCVDEHSDAADRLPARERAGIKQLLKDVEIDLPTDAVDWVNLLQSMGFMDPTPPRSTQDIWQSLDHTSELINATSVLPASVIHHERAEDTAATQDTGEMPQIHPMTEATPAEECRQKIAADLSVSRPIHEGDTLGHYRLDSLIGQGGMGSVYRGTDLITEQSVAIKVLRTNGKDIAQSVRRFRKEARLLAEVQNDYVTRLYEIGHDRGVHFLAMELIEGISLKDWLQAHGPLNEADSLRLMSDISRALLEAHERGIVHRDIKPENILLARRSSTSFTSETIEAYQVKLSDFGIARQIHQSGSLEVTHAGTLLGTPLYMAPEQFKGDQAIDPTVDIYALGVTWFQLLTGQLPFASNDAMKLAAMHCFDAPPSLQKLRPELTDTVCAIVQRMLAKSRLERYSDAGQLLREIERLLRGETAAIESHPRAPACLDVPLWERTFSWELKSSPTQLWPFVSNTERLNRALGLPSVNYRTENHPQGGVRKFGEFKLGAVHVAWEEHPFEWIEGKRMGILRELLRDRSLGS